MQQQQRPTLAFDSKNSAQLYTKSDIPSWQSKQAKALCCHSITSWVQNHRSFFSAKMRNYGLPSRKVASSYESQCPPASSIDGCTLWELLMPPNMASGGGAIVREMQALPQLSFVWHGAWDTTRYHINADPHGSITNSDLKLAALILIFPCYHEDCRELKRQTCHSL